MRPYMIRVCFADAAAPLQQVHMRAAVSRTRARHHRYARRSPGY